MKTIALLFSVLLFCASASAQPDVYDPGFIAELTPTAAGGVWSPLAPTNTHVQALRSEDLTGSTDDPITTWTANVGKNAANAGGAERPLLKLDGPNSRRYLRFSEGAGGYMATANWDGGAISQPFTIVICFREYSASPDFGVSFDGNDSGSRVGGLRRTGTAKFQIFGAVGTGVDVLDVDTAWHSMVVIFNGASTEVSIDGSAWALVNTGTDSTDGITLAAAYNFTLNGNYDIGEVHVWAGAFNDVNKAGATNYFGARWH